MANSLHSETRHSYSWWWDSHISPKNSKWLQENLTDIDGKVKSMIKIINEDADSFARRAEMYYKKRPELMKLVEEFYRAYRALADRYDHATGELRLAHRTMIEAFPNQVSFMPGDDAPEPDDVNKVCGVKQLNEFFQTGEAVLKELKTAEERLMGGLQGEKDTDSSSKPRRSSLSSDKNHNLDLRTMILNLSEQARKVEAEVQRLRQELDKMEAERDIALVQYQQSSEKLSDMETKLSSAEVEAKELVKHASEVQVEVKALKESLRKLEAERDLSLSQFKDASERVASLEAMAAAAQEDVTRWKDQAAHAETGIQNLKEELSRSETEKQGALSQYNESLGKIFGLEEKLRLADENAKRHCEQNEQTECEIKALKEELSRVGREKEDAYLRYQQCLDMISDLKNELMEAKEEVKRLKSEFLLGSAKLQGVEEQCSLLETMNQSLKLEANDLMQEIAAKDRELSQKQTELDNLMNCLRGEQSSFMQVEAALHALQNVHFQSQQELRNGLQMLKNLEVCKQDLEAEIQHLREENRGLNDMKLASSVAEKDLQKEIKSVGEIKEKLEGEVNRQLELNELFQKKSDHLKEELEDLYKKYQDLLQQVESAGIDPNCLKLSIKDLRDENSRLKQVANDGRIEKEGLLRKLQDMEGLAQRSSVFGSSFVDVKVELESSREKMRALQESCTILSGEKLSLVAEKTALHSQLKIITDSMQKLLENNITLEKSLQGANIELEGLRVKSKGLEDLCQYLKDDKSNLLSERSALVYRLVSVEKKLEELVTSFVKLEGKYADLEKEKNSANDQVTELRISLGAEKQKHEYLILTNDARLSGLQDHIRRLQEENRCRKSDFEEQLNKALNAQVEILILQKFMKDMEEKYCTLLAECQKLTEAEKYSEMIISELESENMMQHLETDYLLDRVDKLRRGICQVLKALEIDHVSEGDPEIFLPHVRGKIKDIRRYISESKDENQQLLIQNNVLSAVIKQLNSDGQELTARKEAVDHKLSLLNQQHALLASEKKELLEQSRQLDMIVVQKEKGQETLKTQMEGLNSKKEALEKEYTILQKAHSDLLKTNWFLQDKLTCLAEEKHVLEEENSGAIAEALAFSIQSVVFKNSWAQRTFELGRVAHSMCCLQEAYRDLELKVRELETNLAVKETENMQLRELIQQLEEKNQELYVCNHQLNQQCVGYMERLHQKDAEMYMADQRIQTTQDMNTELHTAMEVLQVQYEALDVTRRTLEQQVLELSECREHQEKDIVLLREANGDLESVVGELSEKIEACKIREAILSSELQLRSSECQLWEAEATSFYSDLQISCVRETLLENTVRELSGLYEDLEDVSSIRSAEIKRLKTKISLLETESEGLKSDLAAYVPVIASLKDNIASLEKTHVLQTKLYCPCSEEQQVTELMVQDINERNLLANAKEKSSSLVDGLSELQDLQSRVKAIESILVVEKASLQKHVNANIKLEAATKEIKRLKSIANPQPSMPIHDAKRKAGNRRDKYLDFGPGAPEIRNGARTKDIPLDHASNASSSSSRGKNSMRFSDHVLDSSETPDLDPPMNLTLSKTQKAPTSPPWSEHIHLEIGELTESNPGEIGKELCVDSLYAYKSKQGGNNSNDILERLASDAQKLAGLQMLIQELRGKIETNKKSKGNKDVEYKRLESQLQDVENSVFQLVDMNTELTQTIKETPSCSGSTEPAEVEQATRYSERIVSLQLELQRIEHILAKLEDERNNNTTIVVGESRFSRIRTGFILREYVQSHGRRSRKQKNSRFCGCFAPSHK